jgi:hypothetical protein
MKESLNIDKAKQLLEKNRRKIGPLVGKATDQVDKLSKGKTSSVTNKIDQAAMKFSHSTSSSDETTAHETTADEMTADEMTADDKGSETPDPAS